MSDLIDRQEAIEAIEPTLKSILQGNSFKAINVMDKIRELPAAQPEQKKGEWKRWYETLEDASGVTYIPRCQCSECGTEYDPHTASFINFCPQCGADMRGEQDERDGNRKTV